MISFLTWMKNVILKPFQVEVFVTSRAVTSLEGSVSLNYFFGRKSCQELDCVNILRVDTLQKPLSLQKFHELVCVRRAKSLRVDLSDKGVEGFRVPGEKATVKYGLWIGQILNLSKLRVETNGGRPKYARG
jgi:hypothetical protein